MLRGPLCDQQKYEVVLSASDYEEGSLEHLELGCVLRIPSLGHRARISHTLAAHLANRLATSGFVLPHHITLDMRWSSSSPGCQSITQSDPPECEISGLAPGCATPALRLTNGIREQDATNTATRSSGILLHPTSLPGRFGIGDLGPTAYTWIDQLVRARQKWWQILPLGPTGYGDSPYQCFSAFAGNPLLISPELLVKDGLLMPHDLAAGPFRDDRVIFGWVVDWKKGLLTRAWENFQAKRDSALHDAVAEFSDQRAAWLEDFSLFMALKEAHGGASLVAMARADSHPRTGGHERCPSRFGRSRCTAPVYSVPVFPAVGRSEAPSERARYPVDRRLADFCFQRFGRRLGESGSFLPRRASPAYRGCGSAAGLFQRDRPALGEPALQLGSVKAGRISLVAGSARRDARTGGRCAARSFSRVRGVLGSASERDDCDKRPLGCGTGRRFFRRRQSTLRPARR